MQGHYGGVTRALPGCYGIEDTLKMEGWGCGAGRGTDIFMQGHQTYFEHKELAEILLLIKIPRSFIIESFFPRGES